MTPPTFLSHPVADKSCGEQFQSPPRIHGPTSPLNGKAVESSSSKLHGAEMPPFPAMLKRYGLPQWTPPRPMQATLRMQKCPVGCKCWDCFTAIGSDIPMKFRTATDVPAELPPACETVHPAMDIDHLEFRAVCSAWSHSCPPGIYSS